VSTGLWAGDKRQNVAAARARIARERFDSSKSRVPTGFSDIDGVLGRIRVTRVPTAFWPLTTTNQRVCRTNCFEIRSKCLRSAELRLDVALLEVELGCGGRDLDVTENADLLAAGNQTKP